MHGSAPDIAGQDIANPMAMVLSAAMMCRYGLSLPQVCVFHHLVLNAARSCLCTSCITCAPPGTEHPSKQYAGQGFATGLTCSSQRAPPLCWQVADQLEAAVMHVLEQGYRTGDLMSEGMKQIGCSELGNVIEEYLQ